MMQRTTILVSASRFGSGYFLDVLARARPGDVVLQDIFRFGGASLGMLSNLLALPEADIAKMAGEDPGRLWSLLRAASDRDRRHVIAKVYYYHLPRDSALWSDMAGCRVIHLVRRNLLEAYLSRLQAQRSQLWHADRADQIEKANMPIDLDPGKAARFIAERRAQIAWARRRFSAAEYHEVAYEDVAAGPLRCRRVITDIFGSDAPEPCVDDIGISRVRLKRKSNADVIRNYGDVAHLDHAYL